MQTECGDALRAPIELVVEYKRLNRFFADYLRSISRGGVYVETGHTVPVGTRFLFKLILPGFGDPVWLHGVVADLYAEDDAPPTGIWIQFSFESDRAWAQLEEFVDALMCEALGPTAVARIRADVDRERNAHAVM